jgi:hypothetical protein
MEDVVTVLKNQGLQVGNSRNEHEQPMYLLTDDEGITYHVSRVELEELQERGKLTLEGIKEHDEKIRRQSTA